MFRAMKGAWAVAVRPILLGSLALIAVGCLGCVPVYVQPPAGESYVSDFDYLSDYGEWLRIPHYGMVWRPYVVPDWRPFYHGHWSWTHDGWAWVSYEPFGWLVYHYGFWDYNPRYGWIWIPGAEWSPARVEWYTFGPYCAWAPLPPPRMKWHDPWDPYDIDVWIVIKMDHFVSDDVGRYRLKTPIQREIAHRDVVFKRAPTREQMEKTTDRRIPTILIEKRPMNVLPEQANRTPEPGRPRSAPLKRMVLPDQDEKRVRENAPQVERDVLVPKKTIERKERTQPENEKERTETETKKKTRTR